MGLHIGHASIETYMALVAYIVIHQIYVIAGDFIEAFSIPPLNIGIYIDKLASVRALLMAIADILEWSITQKGFKDAGAIKTLTELSARRIGSVMSFIAMLICRFYYMWVVYYSDNKSLVAFITLSVEGFWFGVFQMGFFAIGPEYNAFTSFALHVTGNFVFFFQMILDSIAETRPHINSLYKVRVHAWISVVTTFIALPPWVYFCNEYIQGDSQEFKELVNQLKKQLESQPNPGATQVAEKISTALAGRTTEITAVVQQDFGLPGANVSVSSKTVTVTIGSESQTQGKEGSAEVKVNSETITITIKGDKVKSKSQARRIAYKLGSALAKVDKVNQGGEEDTPIPVKISQPSILDKPQSYHWLSPFLLFPLGSFFKDFIYPGILPYAFLDCENANLINYTMPILYMCGPIFILLVNDVFHPTGFAKDPELDSWFKDWSENEGKGKYYHYMWLLHIPMFAVYLISLFAIHGIYPSLRVIVQSRWRVFVLTMVVLIPRSHLEVMDYVGVANYAIAASETGDFEGFTILSWNDMLSMFCRFCNGKLAVGYNWTRVSLGYCFQRDPGNFHGCKCSMS